MTTPAQIRQATLRRIFREAKKAGAERVEVEIGQAVVKIVLGKDNGDSGNNPVRTVAPKPRTLI